MEDEHVDWEYEYDDLKKKYETQKNILESTKNKNLDLEEEQARLLMDVQFLVRMGQRILDDYK